MDLNTITITGRLANNAEQRWTNGSQRSVLSFDIAVDRPSSKYVTDFFTVKMFGTYGERLKNYLNKGTRVAIAGELQTNKWESKNGTKHNDIFISAQNVVLLDKTERIEEPKEKTAVEQLTEELDEMFGDKQLAEYIGDDDELPF